MHKWRDSAVFTRHVLLFEDFPLDRIVLSKKRFIVISGGLKLKLKIAMMKTLISMVYHMYKYRESVYGIHVLKSKYRQDTLSRNYVLDNCVEEWTDVPQEQADRFLAINAFIDARTAQYVSDDVLVEPRRVRCLSVDDSSGPSLCG